MLVFIIALAFTLPALQPSFGEPPKRVGPK